MSNSFINEITGSVDLDKILTLSTNVLGYAQENLVTRLSLEIPEELKDFNMYVAFGLEPTDDVFLSPLIAVVPVLDVTDYNYFIYYDIPAFVLKNEGTITIQILATSLQAGKWKSQVRECSCYTSIGVEYDPSIVRPDVWDDLYNTKFDNPENIEDVVEDTNQCLYKDSEGIFHFIDVPISEDSITVVETMPVFNSENIGKYYMYDDILYKNNSTEIKQASYSKDNVDLLITNVNTKVDDVVTIASATLALGSWVVDGTKFSYTITNDSLLATSFVEIIPISQEMIDKFNSYGAEAIATVYEGYLKLYSTTSPAEDLEVEYVIFN